jgi:hypothetical protein
VCLSSRIKEKIQRFHEEDYLLICGMGKSWSHSIPWISSLVSRLSFLAPPSPTFIDVRDVHNSTKKLY